MSDLEILLRKYMNNFLVLDKNVKFDEIKYFNYDKIAIVTDENLIKDKAVLEIINYLKNTYKINLIILSSGEPNYEVIESTSKKIFNKKSDRK